METIQEKSNINWLAVLGGVLGALILGESVNATNILHGNFLRDRLGLGALTFDTPRMLDFNEYEDSDFDGLTNALEYKLGTNPFNYDSDNDKIPDTYEAFSLADYRKLYENVPLRQVEEGKLFRYFTVDDVKTQLGDDFTVLNSDGDKLRDSRDPDADGDGTNDIDEISALKNTFDEIYSAREVGDKNITTYNPKSIGDKNNNNDVWDWLE